MISPSFSRRMQHRPRLSLNVHPTWARAPAQEANVSPRSFKLADPSDTPTSPTPITPTPMHVRRKTYAGDMAAVSRDVIREYEGRIALLESQNARISVELEQARDALSDEREERKIERHSLILSSPPAPIAPPPTELDGHINEQSELLYERRLRVEILETLKKIRAQNTALSRELREHKDKSASLAGILDAEREEKEQMREELTRLSQKNFTLLEHNKLLVGRDSTLQEEIATLVTKSQADDWMRSILEAELRKVRQDFPDSLTSQPSQIEYPTLTLEHQGPLRCQLVAARDELHITQLKLQESEKKCKDLDERVHSLQQNMTRCLDSSSKALEMERGLRAELAQHATTLESENTTLKQNLEVTAFELESLKQSCISVQDDAAVLERSQSLENENEQLKHQMDTMNLQMEQLRRRQRLAGRVDALVSENEHLKSCVTVLEVEVDTLRRNSGNSRVASGTKVTVNLNQQAVCGNVQKVTVGVRNVSTLQVIPEDTSLPYDEVSALKMQRRERLLDCQFRLAASRRLCQHHRRRRKYLPPYFSIQPALSLPTEDKPSPEETSLSLSNVPDMLDKPPDPFSPEALLLSPTPLPPTRSRDPLRSPSRKRFVDVLSPIDTTSLSSHPASPFPSIVNAFSPSTPQKPILRAPYPTPIGEFPSGIPFFNQAPDSPDSMATASTLVSSVTETPVVTPEIKTDYRRSVMLVTALSSRKSQSFEHNLKSSSTLSVTTEVDVNNQKPFKSVRFKKRHDVINSSGHGRRPRIGRASAALADIVRSYSGFDNVDDWLIV